MREPKVTHPQSLLNITARYIATHFPFEVVDLSPFVVPEELQKLIAFYSFPTNEADIWLYSCLSVGGSNAFNEGVSLWAKDAVRDCMQIGFHLSANVLTEPTPQTPPHLSTSVHRVSLSFDRGHLTSCSCTCATELGSLPQQQPLTSQLPPPKIIDATPDLKTSSSTSLNSLKQRGLASGGGIWCAHIVATCLKRIRSSEGIILRAPISESLSRLSKEELQKFAQNLIFEVGAKKILPAAQNILDQLLAPLDNPLKSCAGAPDPTAGGFIGDIAAWCFDGSVLEEKLRLSLRRFCTPKSIFYGDLSSLYSHSPCSVEEMTCILRSLRAYEPRGAWDLLVVIVDMRRRDDRNAVPLLEVVTRCLLEMEEIMAWWYVVQLNLPMVSKPSNLARQKQSCYSATWLCEAVVDIWRLVCLDPRLRRGGDGGMGDRQRDHLAQTLLNWHQLAIEKAQMGLKRMLVHKTLILGGSFGSQDPVRNVFSSEGRKLFTGFKPAVDACRYALIPHFDGAFVDEDQMDESRYHANPRVRRLLQEEVPYFTSKPDPSAWHNYPTTKGQFGVDFARCQGLVSHGDTCAALAWARHLALQTLLLAPRFVAAAKSATIAGLHMAVLIDKLTECGKSIDSEVHPSTSRQGAVSSTSASCRKYRRGSNPVVNSATGVTGLQSRRGGVGGGGGGSRRGNHTTTSSVSFSPVTVSSRKPSEKEQLEKTQARFAKSEVAVFGLTFTQWVYHVQYLMDCLHTLHSSGSASGRIVHPPALSNRRLIKSRGLLAVDEDSAADTHSSPPSIAEWRSVDTELAFRLGLLMLALPRPQHLVGVADVRFVDHEATLLSRLYRLPLESACPWVLGSVRREARLLANGLKQFNECLSVYVPYSLAVFLFQTLAGSNPLPRSSQTQPPLIPHDNSASDGGDEAEASPATGPVDTRNDPSIYAVLDNAVASESTVAFSALLPLRGSAALPLSMRIQRCGGSTDAVSQREDGELAFALACRVFHERTRISENAAPMFVECQRSQMRDFILNTIRYYKEKPRSLSVLLEACLDRSLNAYFKPPPLWMCLSASASELMRFRFGAPPTPPPPPPPSQLLPSASGNEAGQMRDAVASAPVDDEGDAVSQEAVLPSPSQEKREDSVGRADGDSDVKTESPTFSALSVASMDDRVEGPKLLPESTSTVADKLSHRTLFEETPSASEDTDTLSDSKAWVKRFRCTTLRDPRKLNRHSVGMAAIDSSAPETTSSDNSPATSRRRFFFSPTNCRLPEEPSQVGSNAPARPDVDSSSDCPSSSTGEEPKPVNFPEKTSVDCAHPACGDVLSFVAPPQRPTELFAFHMFQLAKTVRLVAGGPSASGSVFVADAEAHGAAHRNLQLVAFQIGLYALGLYNSLHASWQSRTYSRHVTWISQQVLEIGLPAAFVLYHSWQNHLNAAELAALAFQLSSERDRALTNLAAELCLASLTDFATLKPHEILRALSQLSAFPKTLERGLLCIERGADASPYGILPEIHFHLARSWFDLYTITKAKQSEIAKSAPVTAAEERSVGGNAGTWPGSGAGSQPPTPQFFSSGLMTASSFIQPFSTSQNFPYYLAEGEYQMPQTPLGLYAGQSAQQICLPPPPPPAAHLLPQSQFYNLLSQNDHPPQPPGNAPAAISVPIQYLSATFPTLASAQYLQQLTISAGNRASKNLSEYCNKFLANSLASLACPSDIGQSSVTGTAAVNDTGDAASTSTTTAASMFNNPATSVVDGGGSLEEEEPEEEEDEEEDEEGEGVAGSSLESDEGGSEEASVRKLETKAQNFLRRSFLSALCAIGKLFPSRTLQLDSSSPQNRGSGSRSGHRHHHYHSHHSYHQGNGASGTYAPTLQQPAQTTNSIDNNPIWIPSLGETDGILWSEESDSWRCSGATAGSITPEKAFNFQILWTLDVAGLLGPPAVCEYCSRVLQCIQCPLLMYQITRKVLERHYLPSDPVPPLIYSQGSSGGPTVWNGYTWVPCVAYYQPTHHRYAGRWQSSVGVSGNTIPWTYQPWSVAAQPQQSMVVSTSAVNNQTSVNFLGKDLVERMVNRIHNLYHRQLNQRLRHIGQSRTEWDEFVGALLNAYQAHLGMPATDRAVSWDTLLARIQRHPKCSPALWQRILAGIQTIDLKGTPTPGSVPTSPPPPPSQTTN
ncbi:unnamed protein product [Mesocestoides corti]|uniref:ZSWIM8 TPR repeats domain-containing protein n=1 Tax=Mesocestoides corti TaxID=53468 RepID=A0A158QU41_MESCO|nr:unnamed protein product [Mesocestoides corti]